MEGEIFRRGLGRKERGRREDMGGRRVRIGRGGEEGEKEKA